MLIPKKNRKEVYKYLFSGAGCARERPAAFSGARLCCGAPALGCCRGLGWMPSLSADPAAVPAEGVLYAEKDFNLKEHPDIPGVPNLQVGATLALLAAWPLGATSSFVSVLVCSGWSPPLLRASAACAWLRGCSRPRLCTQVIKMMQSFKSKELVTERFAWRHYYWCASCCAWPWQGAEPCAENAFVRAAGVCKQVPDRRGHRVPARVPEPAVGDRARHAQEVHPAAGAQHRVRGWAAMVYSAPRCWLALLLQGVSVTCTLPLTCAIVQRRFNQVLANKTCASRQLLRAHSQC